MRSGKVFAAVLFICCASLGLGQDSADGNSLLEKCSLVLKMYEGQNVSSPIDNLHAGTCLGLVRGIADTLNLWRSSDAGPVDNTEMYGCMPDGLKTIQLVRIVVKYLNDNPAKLQWPDTTLVGTALAAAFPCKRK
jgi:hypothetical protein